MLDMGFESTIRNIAGSSNLPGKEARQTLMLSATFPESIQLLAANYLNDYIFITVGRVGSASSDIAQSVVEIPGSEKRTKLEEILLESGLVFFKLNFPGTAFHPLLFFIVSVCWDSRNNTGF